MTRQETYQLISLFQAFYPDTFRGLSDEAARLKISLWQEFFAHDPGALVLSAAKAFIASDLKGFPPVPGQIREHLIRLTQPPERDELEAWHLVVKALQNSSYHAAEEFAKLPEDVRAAVGSPYVLKNWAILDTRELDTVVASHFKKDYRALQTHRRDRQRLLPQKALHTLSVSPPGLPPLPKGEAGELSRRTP